MNKNNASIKSDYVKIIDSIKKQSDCKVHYYVCEEGHIIKTTSTGSEVIPSTHKCVFCGKTAHFVEYENIDQGVAEELNRMHLEGTSKITNIELINYIIRGGLLNRNVNKLSK